MKSIAAQSVLPQRIDNTFRGQRPAVWLLALILLVKSAQNVSVLFAGASVISGADGVPLDTYPEPAAQTIVSVWAHLGFARLLVCLLGLLVLIRYRSMLPFMFGLLAFLDVGRYVIFHYLPIVRVGTPPGPIVNWVLMGLTLVGLVLSVWPRRNAELRS